MRIEQFRQDAENGKARISAWVRWEDSARASLEVFFETEARFAEALSPLPDAFLTAAIVPALWGGERRIRVEGEVCPQLVENLENAITLLLHWHGDFRPPIRIEAETRAMLEHAHARQAGVFLSGGLDSLFTLRDNRLRYAREHPLSLRYGILVHGFDMGYQPGKNDLEAFEEARAALVSVAEETGIELVPLFTNLRQLNNDIDFWAMQFHGAALGAVGQALSGMLGHVSIASSETALGGNAWGSHPLLDPLYSSYELQVIHHGMRYSRLDKTRLVADWPTGLNNLRVCLKNLPGKLNCGYCEKCVRTRLMLVAAGKLADCHAFDAGDVTAEQVRHLSTDDPAVIHMYETLREPLTSLGRADLASAVEQVARRSQRYLAWRDGTGGSVQARLKRMDRRFLGGKVFKAYSRLFP